MDVESHTSEARSWSDSPPCALGSGQGHGGSLCHQGKGGQSVIGGTDVGLAHCYQGMQQRGWGLE